MLGRKTPEKQVFENNQKIEGENAPQ